MSTYPSGLWARYIIAYLAVVASLSAAVPRSAQSSTLEIADSWGRCEPHGPQSVRGRLVCGKEDLSRRVVRIRALAQIRDVRYRWCVGETIVASDGAFLIDLKASLDTSAMAGASLVCLQISDGAATDIFIDCVRPIVAGVTDVGDIQFELSAEFRLAFAGDVESKDAIVVMVFPHSPGRKQSTHARNGRCTVYVRGTVTVMVQGSRCGSRTFALSATDSGRDRIIEMSPQIQIRLSKGLIEQRDHPIYVQVDERPAGLPPSSRRFRLMNEPYVVGRRWSYGSCRLTIVDTIGPIVADGINIGLSQSNADIVIGRARTLVGVVVDPYGAPAAFAKVDVYARDSQPISNEFATCYTDEEGRFRVAGIRRDEAVVVVAHDSGGASRVMRLDDDGPRHILLAPWRRILFDPRASGGEALIPNVRRLTDRMGDVVPFKSTPRPSGGVAIATLPDASSIVWSVDDGGDHISAIPTDSDELSSVVGNVVLVEVRIPCPRELASPYGRIAVMMRRVDGAGDSDGFRLMVDRREGDHVVYASAVSVGRYDVTFTDDGGSSHSIAAYISSVAGATRLVFDM